MSDPLNQETGRAGREEQRRSTAEKVLAVVDVFYRLAIELLRIFGRRKSDPRGPF